MSTVLVQAHPFDESYSAALLEAAVDGLGIAGVEPVVVRLHQGQPLDAATVESAEHLAFVYPTWWGGVPGMLLGPLTELLGPWVDGAAPASTSPLRTVRRLTVVTTYGGSKLINLVQGEAGLHLFKRTVMRLCAPGAVHERHAIHDVVNAGETELTAFVDRVRRSFSATV